MDLIEKYIGESVIKSGKKPSQEKLADILVKKGLLRINDAGKKILEWKVRNALPNNKWLTGPELANRLYKASQELKGYAIRILREWAKAGILDRRYTKDGEPIYAWKGATPKPNTIAWEDADDYFKGR